MSSEPQRRDEGEWADAIDVLGVLAHRFPFLLVDRLRIVEPGRRALGLKRVTGGEWFGVASTAPDPEMPGLLVVEALARFYRLYVPAASVKLVRDVAAGHAMVTGDYGGSCSVTAAPYINNCHYDAAGQLLEYIEGPLAQPAAQEGGRLVSFDQSEFTNGSPGGISMADTGYAYVPRNCDTKSCRVHVAFHGCEQSAEAQGLAFVRHAGYNRWADTNGMIVLYPQTVASYGLGGWPPRLVFNPHGCWDWWGYTTPDYHTRNGPQIRAIKAMLDRLGQKRPSGK